MYVLIKPLFFYSHVRDSLPRFYVFFFSLSVWVAGAVFCASETCCIRTLLAHKLHESAQHTKKNVLIVIHNNHINII